MVPAGLVVRDAGVTWEVPAFAAGHAERTAGAGAPGNAVLVGHVTSPEAGSVFRPLDRVGRDDRVRVFSGDAGFDYLVTDVRTVARTDVSVVAPTERGQPLPDHLRRGVAPGRRGLRAAPRGAGRAGGRAETATGAPGGAPPAARRGPAHRLRRAPRSGDLTGWPTTGGAARMTPDGYRLARPDAGRVRRPGGAGDGRPCATPS